MTMTAGKETLGFQTEVTQLLHLMVHSLYGNKEIFLRELVSNASDACDKLRFDAIAQHALLEDNPDLKIHVSYDRFARTITASACHARRSSSTSARLPSRAPGSSSRA